MKVRELRLPQEDPFERGVAYGTALAEDVRQTIELYRAAYKEFDVAPSAVGDVVESSILAVRDLAPVHWAELEGLSKGSGASADDLMLLTARTEILAHAQTESTECTTAVALPAGRAPVALQTWDWHGDLAPTGVMLEMQPAGRTVRMFSETGMLGKIGVTRGLGVLFNILQHVEDGSRTGLPVHIVMRRILDEASSIEDAIRIARECPVAASTVLTVVQAESATEPARAASIELSPAGVGVIESDGGWLAHTNHFLDPELAKGDASTPTSTTAVRMGHAQRQRDALMQADGFVQAATGLCGPEGVDAPVCMREKSDAPLVDRWGTLLSIGIELEHGSLSWFAGPPSDAVISNVSRF